MKGRFPKRLARILAHTLFLATLLSVLAVQRYIDFSVIMTVYLPIWVIGVVAAWTGRLIFADVIVVSAGVGLVVEYLVHVANKPYPNMSGAFLNTLILLVGLVAAIVLQTLSSKRAKRITG